MGGSGRDGARCPVASETRSSPRADGTVVGIPFQPGRLSTHMPAEVPGCHAEPAGSACDRPAGPAPAGRRPLSEATAQSPAGSAQTMQRNERPSAGFKNTFLF